MNKTPFVIRPVEARDNAQLERLIVTILAEFGCVGEGFACADPEVKVMYETYRAPGSAYWVVADPDGDSVYGGAGFARLKGTTEDEAICELQKLYFDPVLRGHGFGRKMLSLCVDEATRAGYRQMYLESVPQMHSAVSLYEKLGFTPLEGPTGNTGHNKCTIFMSRPLTQPAPVEV